MVSLTWNCQFTEDKVLVYRDPSLVERYTNSWWKMGLWCISSDNPIVGPSFFDYTWGQCAVSTQFVTLQSVRMLELTHNLDFLENPRPSWLTLNAKTAYFINMEQGISWFTNPQSWIFYGKCRLFICWSKSIWHKSLHSGEIKGYIWGRAWAIDFCVSGNSKMNDAERGYFLSLIHI